MPAKKAAKKSAKKAAKKAAKKSAKHAGSHDLRRAYEHLGRLEIVGRSLSQPGPKADIAALAELAQQELAAGHAKPSADLLRAAEHLSFAVLAPHQPPSASTQVSAELNAAIAAEFDHLTQRAENLWSASVGRHRNVAKVFASSMQGARLAFDRRAYRPALEFARAADALAHIANEGAARIAGTSDGTRRLAS